MAAGDRLIVLPWGLHSYGGVGANLTIGEVGLGGEIRQVPQAPRRLAEALRLGDGNIVFLNDEEAKAATVTNAAVINRAWDLWKAQALGN